MIEINGDWIGFYTYGKGYTELNKLLTVPFNATIKKGIYLFVGRVTEELEYGGIDDEIVIRGQLSGTDIEFIKYYSREHVLDSGNETVSHNSAYPSVVHYKGTYHEGDEKFMGTWEIPELREDDEGVFHAENPSGYWEMRRDW